MPRCVTLPKLAWAFLGGAREGRSMKSHATHQVDDSSEEAPKNTGIANVGGQGPHKNSNSHIDASHSRQPLVKGERLVRYEVNAVMLSLGGTILSLVLKALD